jgi:tetratricopeptide (TPR) repeat protein
MTLRELNAVTGPEMLQLALIGFRFYEEGKYEEAKTIFHGLVTLDPKESYYHSALGAVYLALDDLEQAERFCNQAIGLNSKEIASYVNRGEVFLRKGMVLEAAQDFKKAVDLDPQGKDPLTSRARVLAAAALETIEQAQAEAAGGDKKAAKAPAKPPAKPAAKPAAKASGKSAGKKK